MTRRLTYVEVDLPHCALTYGNAPCRATRGDGSFPAGGGAAAVLDGTTNYLRRVGGWTGAADGKTFTISGWIVKLGGDATLQYVLVGASALAGATIRGIDVNISTGNALNIRALNAAGTVILNVSTAANSLEVADGPTHFVASFDLTDTAKRHIYLDGVDSLTTVTTYTDDTIAFTIADWAVGALPSGGSKLSGQLADLWLALVYFAPANYVYFSPSPGVAAYLGDDGDVLANLPIVFLSSVSSAVDTWPENKGTGGGLTLSGDPLEEGPHAASEHKCFNTLKTCQDPTNFDDEPITLRFAQAASYLPKEIESIDSLVAVDVTPGVISLGENLGQRATLEVTLSDHPWADTPPSQFDKYLADRDYDPFRRGTFWGKFRARHPYVRSRSIRLITGDLGQAIGDMETRHFVMESTNGPSPVGGLFTIVAKDVLKLADNDRAQAPAPSNGFLSGAIDLDDTAATLAPSGIGNIEYPASGYLNLGGSEIVAFTRTNDALTLTRAQFNTVGVAHAAEDKAQLCLYYSGEDAADVIDDLFQNYAGIDAAFIPLTNWQTETGTYLGTLYTRLIPEPTGVNRLVSDLIQQAALAMWWDDVGQQIRLQVLRPVSAEALTLTEDDRVEDSLAVDEQPDKRVSAVFVYYGVINPLRPVDEPDNYRSTSLREDLTSETNYGSSSIKRIFASWIPALASQVAERLTEVVLGRFVDPPRKISFDLLRVEPYDVGLGDGLRVEGWAIQDALGARTSAPVQVTQLKPTATKFHVVAEELLLTSFSTVDQLDRQITIDSDFNNFNLRTVHDGIFPEVTAQDVIDGVTLTVTIASGVVVGATSILTAAFTVGSFPAGLPILVTNYGLVQGEGGNAGNGVPLFGSATAPQAGGPAFYTRQAIDLDNTGASIKGGGGGGGGGGSGAGLGDNQTGGGGGGGGGAGRTAGGAGLGETTAAAPGSDGSPGTLTAGGAPGSGGTEGGGVGGDGGTGGAPGTAGGNGVNSGSGIITTSGQTGGAAGIAIDGISFITVIASGTITGAQVN